MKYYENPAEAEWTKICRRNNGDLGSLDSLVKSIFNKVDKTGDKALFQLTKQFDSIALDSLSVDKKRLDDLASKVEAELADAIDEAYDNIYKFNKNTALRPTKTEATQGVKCWSELRPIERVGLYVPGGSAPLVSTVLMLGVPARLAGCKEIVLATPPNKKGAIDPAICYAAKKCGITNIVTVGGAQAVAAMAIGTESIPKVDKIFGPGNQYVTAAKQYAQNYQVAIDMPAGPSEVMVIADKTAKADFVAADLLSQAEHGPDSQVSLLTDNKSLAKQVLSEIEAQLKTLPRKNIAKEALQNSFIVVFNGQQALDFVNFYAPEHLIVNVKNPKAIAKKINNAGSVFLGEYSPESAGDYASGTNHTLPTGGWAKSYSGLSVRDFQKTITFQKLTKSGLENLSATITTIAQAEGLDAHANAVTIRIKSK